MWRLAVCCVCLLLCGIVPAEAQPRDSFASLENLESVGRLVITVADDTLRASEVRSLVERRLAGEGIPIDPDSHIDLVIEVGADRVSSDDERYALGAFWASVSVREPVFIARSRDRAVKLVTWSLTAKVYRFSKVAPRQGLLDRIDELMSRLSESRQARR